MTILSTRSCGVWWNPFWLFHSHICERKSRNGL